ncbi:GRASP55/65 PDZ-like domain-containing protein [Pterulicium gracile]|uniref:GRASP55/65 PDZ-like domain-containing protein n=1 Tax=Pterulicium gracile TaxID=1884261 RepID=A0A5C3QPU9_9AGAR|nr:GRASP55/65 PDZ-like domain-containing protein [Pterula gracilis]
MGSGQSSNQNQLSSRALHVLRVTPGSPASQTNIEPFFDFIIGFDGATLPLHQSMDISELERIVEAHEDNTLGLMIWNSKNKSTREVSIVPSRRWALQASHSPDHESQAAPFQPSLLGLTMRVCEEHEHALDNVWHVLDVMEDSPAESAGLVPYGDWIIGWSGGVLSAEGDFYDLVEAHVEKPLRVYVYSHDFDALREVVLVPNRHWGGDGLLGCVFGFGLIHRIPFRDVEQQLGVTTPPELLFEEGYDSQTLFVPADHGHHLHAGDELDWYGEQARSAILSPSSLDTPNPYTTTPRQPAGAAHAATGESAATDPTSSRSSQFGLAGGNRNQSIL